MKDNMLRSRSSELNLKLDAKAILQLINYKKESVSELSGYFSCFCPIHKDSVIRTLKVYPQSRSFSCSYNLCKGAGGGTLVDLYALAKDIPLRNALIELAEQFSFELPPELKRTLDVTEIEALEKELSNGVNQDLENRISSIYVANQEQIEAVSLMAELCFEKDQIQDFHRNREKIRNHPESDKTGFFYPRMLTRLHERHPESILLIKELVQYYRDVDQKQNLIRMLEKLADIYEIQEDFNNAAHCIREVVYNDPFLLEHRRKLVQIFLKNRKYDEALCEYISVYETLKTEGKNDRCLEILQNGMKDFPREPRLMKLMLSLSREINNIPLYIQTLEDYYQILVNQSDKESAFSELETAFRFFPQNLEILEMLLDYFTTFEPHLADNLQFKKYLDHFYEMLPQNEHTAYHEIAFDLYLNFFPSAHIFQAYGDHLFTSGDKDGALNAYLRCVDMLFDDDKTREALAISLKLNIKYPDNCFVQEKLRIIEEYLSNSTPQEEKSSEESVASDDHGLTDFLLRQKQMIPQCNLEDLFMGDFNALPRSILEKAIMRKDVHIPLLYIFGPTGIGKTSLISCYLHTCDESDYDYLSALDLFHFYQENHGQIALSTLISELAQKKILILDDLETIFINKEAQSLFSKLILDLIEMRKKNHGLIILSANENVLHNEQIIPKLQFSLLNSLMVPFKKLEINDRRGLVEKTLLFFCMDMQESLIVQFSEQEGLTPFSIRALVQSARILKENNPLFSVEDFISHTL